MSKLAETARGHQQTPAYYDQMKGDFCVAGCESGGAAPAPVPAPALAKSAAVDWLEVKASNTPAVLEAFIADHPEDKTYRALAEERLALLTVKPEVPKPAECDALLVSVADRKDCLKPGDVFHDFDGGPEMVVVPPGTFTMGSSKAEQKQAQKEVGHSNWFRDEGPQHEVTMSKAFAVGKFEVTKGQYAAFVQATGYAGGDSCYVDASGDGNWSDTKGKTWKDAGFPQADDHPVICVSWDDAKAYAAWLAKASGKPYRLLTESEWEYAARGQTSKGNYPRYTFGNDANALCKYGNVGDETAKAKYSGWTVAPCTDGALYTAAAGSFAANPFGVYDMLGNVWEWTEDCYADSYANAPADGSAKIDGDCKNRVLRGGSWDGTPVSLRSAGRGGNTPGTRNGILGFRLARAIGP